MQFAFDPLLEYQSLSAGDICRFEVGKGFSSRGDSGEETDKIFLLLGGEAGCRELFGKVHSVNIALISFVGF